MNACHITCEMEDKNSFERMQPHLKHRQQKVEKVGGAEHCYLRGLLFHLGGVWGHAPLGNFLKNCARRLNLGAFEVKT